MGAVFFKSRPRYDILEYTERQQAIIDGMIPLEEIRTTELSAILKKADTQCDETVQEIVQILYRMKKAPDDYRPLYSVEKAKEILQSLTPWKINWDI